MTEFLQAEMLGEALRQTVVNQVVNDLRELTKGVWDGRGNRDIDQIRKTVYGMCACVVVSLNQGPHTRVTAEETENTIRAEYVRMTGENFPPKVS